MKLYIESENGIVKGNYDGEEYAIDEVIGAIIRERAKDRNMKTDDYLGDYIHPTIATFGTVPFEYYGINCSDAFIKAEGERTDFNLEYDGEGVDM